MSEVRLSRWMRELFRYLPIKTQFCFYGNVYDNVLYPMRIDDGERRYAHLTLREFFTTFLREQGYQLVGFYDLVDGMTILPAEMKPTFERLHKLKADLRPTDIALAIRNVLANREVPAAFVIEFASRLVSSPGQPMQEDERMLFLRLLKAAQGAARVRAHDTTVNNNLSFVCDKLSDLPDWMYLNNPYAKTIEINLPAAEERAACFDLMREGFPDAARCGAPELAQARTTFVELTSGLKLYELESVRILSAREAITLPRIKEAIERYKFGISESAWDALERPRLEGAEETLRNRVKGQDEAIRRVVDILKRAKLGLSGVQLTVQSRRPRGTLFFAGPTGVGKTELAKALAALLFGDEKACVRFDMSEYSQEHSDQRLLGAPPGYVGYEEGGQLTNRMKENPFRVLLFDEIDKAHPRILDKFLQILDDGRMTDGRGETIYFSESIIIFTSNIGAGVVNETMLPDEVHRTILAAIEDHFRRTLGRPELLNRFGHNFVIFGYITPDVADEIIERMLSNIVTQLRETHRAELKFGEDLRAWLGRRARSSLSMGGRGIGNLVEEAVVNPLARYLFSQTDLEGRTVLVEEIAESSAGGRTVYAVGARIQ